MARAQGTLEANAKRECVLMLAGKRDQGRVAKHENIVTLLYENMLAG